MVISCAAWSQVNFGVKGGLNISNTKLAGFMKGVPNVGLNVGGFAQIAINDEITIQPELNFSQMGATLYELLDDSGEKLTLNYLALPVIAKYNWEKFSLFAGPQVSYLMSAKSKYEGKTYDLKKDFKKSEVSGLIGGEYQLTDLFSVNARYQFGLSNITTNATPDDNEDSYNVSIRAVNSAFSFGVGFKF